MRGAGAVIGGGLGGETIGELVIAAVLEEAPHGPIVIPIVAAHLQRVPPPLLVPDVTRLQDGVPIVNRRRGIGIAKGVVALNRDVGHAIGARAAESHSLDAQLGDVVGGEVVLRVAVHGKARHSQPQDVDRRGGDQVRVLKGRVLRQIVVKGSKAGQILRSKIPLGSEGIAREKRVAMGQILVDTQRSLIGKIAIVAQVQEVVGVRPHADGRRPHAHSPHASHPHHAGIHVGKRHLRQLAHGDGAHSILGTTSLGKGLRRVAGLVGLVGSDGL